MEKSHSRRYLPATRSQSPHLIRSKSGGTTPAVSLPEIHKQSFNSSQRFNDRSKSTAKSRIKNDAENINPRTIISSIQKQKPDQESKDGFVRFLQRASPSKVTAPRTKRPVSASPSAWALSPGRASPCLIVPDSPAVGVKAKSGGGGGGGVIGVWKYFRQKKMSPIQEAEVHRFRVLHDRLVQWRFVNARAEASMANMKRVAEGRLFCTWLMVLKMRNSIVAKGIEVQKLKHEIKLYQIINPQIHLLNQWTKLEARNYEAVGRTARKLSALSFRLPLVQGAEAEVGSIYQAMRSSLEVMDSIETLIINFLSQEVEKAHYLLTELTNILKHQRQCLEDMEKIIPSVVILMERERSLRVQLIQSSSGVEEKER